MDAPTDKNDPAKFARIRFQCGGCSAEHRPEKRWTGLAVATQWVKASVELGRLGWRIMRLAKDPHTIRLCCPKCVEAEPS